MTSNRLEFKLPNFQNHNDVEFCRQIYLNHFRNAILFFNKNSDIIRKYLIELLKIPGNDISKDSRIIIYRWGCRCFFNMIKPPYVRPSVPIDFSFIHPELTDFHFLLQSASSEKSAGNLIRLNETFPYELFKVISMMIPQNARDFTTACAFNKALPIHMAARIISLFPLNIVSIDYPLFFEQRCSNSIDQFQDLFEGLLCSADFNLSQLLAAQLLANNFDDLLAINNDANEPNQRNRKSKNYLYLKLINTTIRQMRHFLDCNFALALNLFQSECTLLSFLLQTSTVPFSTLTKAIKQLPPNRYTKLFNNQMILMHFVGIGENWQKLNEYSIPFLIGAEQISNYAVILSEIPRSSLFLTLSNYDYQIDYDFIHVFSFFEDLLNQKKLSSVDLLSNSLFPSEYEVKLCSGIVIDVFSLLFTEKIKHNSTNLYFDTIGRQKQKMGQSFASRFVFDAETALSVVSYLLANSTQSELKPFLEHAEMRIKCALSLFERPVPLEAALLPPTYYFLHSLKSPELLDTLISLFGHPPKFVISRKFTLTLFRQLHLKDRNAAQKISNDDQIYASSDSTSYFCSERIEKEEKLNKRTEEIIDDVLNQFPQELYSLLLLDFASTNKHFTSLAKKNTNETYSEFVNNMFKKAVRFPPLSDVDFQNARTLNDLQKKLCAIISFGCTSKSTLLYRFSAFLLILISDPLQTYSVILKQSPQKSIFGVLQHTNQSSFESIIHRFSDTGIDINEILYSYKDCSIFDERKIMQIINHNPLCGIPLALAASFSQSKLIRIISKIPAFHRIAKYFSQAIKSNPCVDVLSFLNDKDFVNHFETKLDELITKNKVNLVLQKLTESDHDKDKVMMILDYLVYKVDLSSSFDNILIIIMQCPTNWKIQFLETFISILDVSKEAVLFPLQQTLSELKPLHDFGTMSEIEKVCSSWDYLIKEVTKFKNVIDNPQRIYRLCCLHLVHHEIGHALITLVQCMTQIIVFIRNFKLFNSHQSENNWLSKYVKYGISKLKESVLAEMAIDIGMNYNYNCGLMICKHLIKTIETQFDSDQNILPTTRTSFSEPLNNFGISLSNSIKNKLPESIALLNYVPDPVLLADDILSIQIVNSEETENNLLHLLIKMKQYQFVSNSRLYLILNEFVHQGVYKRYRVNYSGESLIGLDKVADKCDLFSLSNLLYEQFKEIESSKLQLFDNFSIFGIMPNRSSNLKQMLCTASIPFDGSKILYESSLDVREMVKTRKNDIPTRNLSLISSLTEISKCIRAPSFVPPTIFSLYADSTSISMFFEPFQSELKELKRPRFSLDFQFFDLEYSKNKRGTSELRIGLDMNSSFTETLALGELKETHCITSSTLNEEINEYDLLHKVHRSILSCSLLDLFNQLSLSEMRCILTFANEKNLLFFILQMVLFAISNQDYMSIFVYPGSKLDLNAQQSNIELYSTEGVDSTSNINLDSIQTDKRSSHVEYNQVKVLDFLLALKFTLISSIRLVDDVDPAILFPSSIIPNGERKKLDDICLAIEYQLQIGIDKLNLFDQAQSGNIAHSVAQVFLNCNDNTDYDRGFALTRVLHVDIDEVMIEAAAQILMQKNEESLGQFLLAILPRLDSSSSNQLIEALSSILVRNSSNEPFLKLIISSIRNPQSSCQMLRWFGFTETSVDVAVLNELTNEIELSMKDATKKGLNHVVRICKRWIHQHRISV